MSSRFPWHIALRSQFSICANGRLFPLGKPADEAEAWGILEANQYDILLHHHDAGHTMPPVPPGAVRLSGELPEGMLAEFAKVPSSGSYQKPGIFYWVPNNWADVGPWVAAHKSDTQGSAACFQIWATTVYKLDAATLVRR